MEKKIIRLVNVVNEKKEIIGYLALRYDEDLFEVFKYGFNESAEMIKATGEKLYDELFSTYSKDLEGLSPTENREEAIEKFEKLGYILKSSSEIITKMTIYDDRIEVEDATGKTSIVSPFMKNSYTQDIIMAYNLINFCVLYGKECFKGLICDEREKTYVNPYEQLDDEEPDYEDPDYEDEYVRKPIIINPKRIIKKSKIRNLKVGKCLVALVTAGAVLALGYGIGKKSGENSNSDNSKIPEIEILTPTEETSKITLTISPTLTPTPSPKLTPTPTPKPTTTPEPIPELGGSFDDEEIIADAPWDFTVADERDVELFTIINSKGLEDQGRYTTDDISDITSLNLEYFYEVIAANLGDLSYFAASNKKPLNNYFELTEAPRKTHFERIIPGLNAIEVEYIKYFSDLNINIIDAGYCKNDAYKAKEINNYVVRDMIKYIIDKQPLWCTVQGQEVPVSFSDLSYEAQDAIRNICWGNYCLLGEDVVEFNGNYYNQALIGLEVFGIHQEPTSVR